MRGNQEIDQLSEQYSEEELTRMARASQARYRQSLRQAHPERTAEERRKYWIRRALREHLAEQSR